MQPGISKAGETSGIFWYWRAPNDSLRTGERFELESALKAGNLTPRSFVWRSDWARWLQAGEVPQLRDAIPAPSRMPAVTPDLVEPAAEPPPLPALYDVLCEAANASGETTHTKLDVKPWFQNSYDDDITTPGMTIGDDEPTSVMVDPELDSMPPSLPGVEQPSFEEEPSPKSGIHEVYERMSRMIRTELPKLPSNWQSQVVRFSVFAACAIGMTLFAAVNAVAIHRALDNRSPALVVTVAGPSQTLVPEVAVTVDNEVRCSQAPCQIELRRGIHLVSVTAPGFAPSAARAVSLDRDQILHFDLVHGSERVAVLDSRQ